MFNKKKIEELERKIADKDDDIRKYLSIIDDRNLTITKLKIKIEEITELKDKIPENCTPGSYCNSCDFAKEYHHSRGMYARTFYVCAKANSCSEFVQKKGDQ